MADQASNATSPPLIRLNTGPIEMVQRGAARPLLQQSRSYDLSSPTRFNSPQPARRWRFADTGSLRGRSNKDPRHVDADEHWLSEDEGSSQIDSYFRTNRSRIDAGELGTSSHQTARRDGNDDDADAAATAKSIDHTTLPKTLTKQQLISSRYSHIISNTSECASADPKSFLEDDQVSLDLLPQDSELFVALKKALACSVCSRAQTDPTTLECGHAFCTRCIAAPISFVLDDHMSNLSIDRQKQDRECPNSTCTFVYTKEQAKAVQTGMKKLDVTLFKICCHYQDYARLHPSEVDNASQEKARVESPASDGSGDSGSTQAGVQVSDLFGSNIEDQKRQRRASLPSNTFNVKRRRRLDHDEIDEEESGTDAEHLKQYSLALDILSELECQVCVGLITDPVTTSCGHTFCRECLCRSIDHSDRCPLCRSGLPHHARFAKQPSNFSLLSVLQEGFPALYKERVKSLQENEQILGVNLPVFICTLAFPATPTFLHIFEPRYRLMMRRAMASDKRFGMVLPTDDHAGGVHAYGTVLEIRKMEVLPDGRSMIETMGVSRFKLLSTGTLDGYTVGQVEMINDISAEEEALKEAADFARRQEALQAREAKLAQGVDPGPPVPPEMTTEQLINRCHEFLTLLRSGAAPWLRQKLNDTLGPIPTDPSDFSFYMAAIMPIYEQEKVKLLSITSMRVRFKLLVFWLEQLRGSWWFNRGCNLM